MRKMLVLLAVLCSSAVAGQTTSSENLSCTVVAKGEMACNGLGALQHENKVPRLSVTHFKVEPGAALHQPSSSSDCLIIGVGGGTLVNEEEPFLHVSLEKDSVTLMPKEKPFRLRNKGTGEVEFRLIEIRR